MREKLTDRGKQGIVVNEEKLRILRFAYDCKEEIRCVKTSGGAIVQDTLTTTS
ncbi:hypothetical protein BVRB_1g005220 [Beta vulgaris subsp. vulgaris]|nr:hypothetical protein BVRB_1g005220 [Beta vulgaris subsp. vulgaris]